MWIVKDKEGCVVLAELDFWEIERRYRMNAQRRNERVVKAVYTDGSKIDRVYGNLFVAFNCYGKQVGLELCSCAGQVFELESGICASIKEWEGEIAEVHLSDGSVATWTEPE